MNRLMFYGGFALAITLFIMAVLFFIIFKIPSVHRYFRKNSKKGLVAAAVVESTEKTEIIRVTQETLEAQTGVMGADADFERTEVLSSGSAAQPFVYTAQPPAGQPASSAPEYSGATAVLGSGYAAADAGYEADKTEVLGGTEIL